MAQVLESLKSDIVQGRRHNLSPPVTRQSIGRVGQSLETAASGGTSPAADPKFSPTSSHHLEEE